MPFFKYKAKNEYNETVKGKVEAKTINSAVEVLESRNLLVIRISPLTSSSFATIMEMLSKVKQDDIVNMTRLLSTMITAGLPLASALSILVKQSKPEVARLVEQILQDIEGGSSFGDALAKYPKEFPRTYIQLVNAGEAGGVMDEVLERLAENMENAKEFRAKTKGAMIYPIIVLIAMFVVGLIMMIFVIPKLTDMYADFGAQLPMATQILISLSNFAVKSWYFLIGGLALAFVGLKKWYKTDNGEKTIDGLILKIPIFGVLRQKMILTEFSRTLSLLLGAGVSLLQALEIVTEGIDNRVYRDAMVDTTKQVEKGVSLSEALATHEEFPIILTQMTGVGEETGKLDEILQKLAHYFGSESEHAVKNLTAAMEPLIMIVLGIGVGAMVIAIVMPIYSLTSQF